MYEETSYEEYMRSVLGYRPMYGNDNIYEPNDYYIMQTTTSPAMQENQCDEMYPEIYHKIYPLICKECRSVNTQLTNELLEKMTENVYQAIEIDLKIETKNVRQEDRQFGGRNNFLRDLIRILILKELLGGRPGPRPPMPGPGPRPPFPGGPGGGPRPPFPGGPIRPRDF